jgi:hypothetical protein
MFVRHLYRTKTWRPATDRQSAQRDVSYAKVHVQLLRSSFAGLPALAPPTWSGSGVPRWWLYFSRLVAAVVSRMQSSISVGFYVALYGAGKSIPGR